MDQKVDGWAGFSFSRDNASRADNATPLEQYGVTIPGWRGLDQTEGENMKIALNIVGAVLVFFGGVWVLQGINVLPGSFMSGQTQWAVRGGIAVIAGIALLVWANRKRHSVV